MRLLRQRRHGVVSGADAGRVAQPADGPPSSNWPPLWSIYVDNFYNVERRYSCLGNVSPTECEHSAGETTCVNLELGADPSVGVSLWSGSET